MKPLSKASIKKLIVSNLGILSMIENGKQCAIKKAQNCAGIGQVAYHLVPQSRGDATRFLRENVVWACAACNNGERWNRTLYRIHHVEIFGRKRIENLELLSVGPSPHYTMANLKQMLKDVREEIAAKGRIPK
jgi:hypothetical protein